VKVVGFESVTLIFTFTCSLEGEGPTYLVKEEEIARIRAGRDWFVKH
jgi:hypothetical protein